MATSLFVEQHTDGIAFYINGELQFHSADEAIYHEYLTIPAIALAAKRFPNQLLRVIICGGGDGLAARDILRFPQVNQIDLVDYSQEVIDLGKQDFASFNQGSLVSPKVAIHIQEAFAFLNRLVQEFCTESIQNYKYHAIICDFTYPASVAETQIYALEWFSLLKQVLMPSGIIATNAVSPDRNTLAFWCIYQTMQAAGLAVKPMQLQIPSFLNHDYGNWGFLLASEKAIICSEVASLDLPSNLRELSLETLQTVFIFDAAIAQTRHSVTIHQKDSSQLLFYLLNRLNISHPNTSTVSLENPQINFLDFQDGPTAIATSNHNFQLHDPMSLETLAQSWLNQLESNPDGLLIPAQHHSHTPEISQEWLGRAKQLLNQIDFPRLIAKLLERSQELPHEIAHDLRELQNKIIKFQQSQSLNEQDSHAISTTSESGLSFNLTTAKVIAIVSLTLLVANLAAPDAVFAKGSTSSSGFMSSSDDGSGLGFLGVMMTVGGIVWLINLANDKQK
ncbi:spermine synthase [Pseudanabaena sp. ABRG5-3]|uniref:spermine/spermidine synthase domain-containing protein n=1 Tax=Pseudanabaena sp. ABRG5-3 TaxID=685565 RepID=UPI000DC71164|nr:spermine synthase [Pseudanabaena sp. ABRG5-3]BBC24601.1 spermidine synthase [Pseudanabaena sp. ABRG5-3]